MQPDSRDASHVWDMLEHARIVVQLTSRLTYHEYMNDRVQQLAMEPALAIVGEAARRLSMPFREAHPDVPWRQIIAQRNVLAHEYDDILHEVLWKTATVDIPALIAQISPLVPPPPADDHAPRDP